MEGRHHTRSFTRAGKGANLEGRRVVEAREQPAVLSVPLMIQDGSRLWPVSIVSMAAVFRVPPKPVVSMSAPRVCPVAAARATVRIAALHYPCLMAALQSASV